MEQDILDRVFGKKKEPDSEDILDRVFGKKAQPSAPLPTPTAQNTYKVPIKNTAINSAKNTIPLAQSPAAKQQQAVNFGLDMTKNLMAGISKINERVDGTKMASLQNSLAGIPQDEDERRTKFLEEYQAQGGTGFLGSPGAYTNSYTPIGQYVNKREKEYQDSAQEYLKLKGRVDSRTTTVNELLSHAGTYNPEQLATAHELISRYEKAHPEYVTGDSVKRALQGASMSPQDKAEWTAAQQLKRRINPLSAAAMGLANGMTFGTVGAAANNTASPSRYAEQAQAAREQGDEKLAEVYDAMSQGSEGMSMTGRDQQQNPAAYIAGSFVGSGIGYGGAAKVITSFGKVGKAAEAAGQKVSALTGGKLSSKVATALVSGRIVDLPGDIINAAAQTIQSGDNFFDFVKKLAGDQAAGLAMDGSIELLAAGYRAVKSAMGLQPKVTMTIPDDELASVREAATQEIPRDHISTYKPLSNERNKDYESVALMNSVASITGEEFKKGEVDLITQVENYFQSRGGFVNNPDLGQIQISRKGVKDSIAHGIGRKKAATFAAVPEVLEKGKIIDFQHDWKGRHYDTYLIAAPVNVANERHYLGAIVIKDKSNHYYLHEVLTAKDASKSFKTGVSLKNKKQYPGDSEAPSVISLLEQFKNVNPPNALDVLENAGKSIDLTGGQPGQLFSNAAKPDTAEPVDMFKNAREQKVKQLVEQANARDAAQKAGQPDMFKNARAQQTQAPEQAVDGFGKNTVGAAQAAEAPERKVSKLFSNSFEKTPLFSEAEKNAAHLRGLDKTYSYDVITEKRSLQEAATRVQVDKSGELADLPVKGEWGGTDVDTAMLLMEDMLKNARQTGNYNDVLKWSKMIQEKATVAGQEIQAFAKYSRTPEGTLAKAQKAVADSWKKMTERKPKLAQQIDKLSDLLKKFVDSGATDVGLAEDVQAIKRALKKLSGQTGSEFDESAIDKILQTLRDKQNGGMDIDDLAKQLAGVPQLDAEDARQIITIMDEARNHSLYSRERAQMEADAYTIVANKLGTTWEEKLNAWRYMAMLTNTRTHIRNIAGNLMFSGVTKVKDSVGTLLESVTSAVKKRKGNEFERTKTFLSPFSESDRALKKAAAADYEDYWAFVTGGGKYNPADKIRDNKTIFKNKVLEGVRKKNFAALEGQDDFFLQSRYKSAMAQYLKSNGYTANVFESQSEIAQSVLERARAYAIDEAQKATFRDASKVAEAINKLSRTNRATNVIVEGIMPFKKTPVNIVKRGIEYSPIGLIQGIGRAVNSVRSGKYTATQAIDRIAAGATGSTILAIGAWLAHEGVLTGAASEDAKERGFDTLTGSQNYALVIGDHKYSLEWASPAALPLFVGVELQKVWTGENGFSDLIDSLTKISEPALDMTMLQGLNDTIQSAAYSQTNALSAVAGNAVTNYMTQAVPSVFGQVARTIDPLRRSTADDKTNGIPSIFEQPARSIAAKIPGVSMLLEPSIDQWGREKKNAGGDWPGRLFNNTISPGFYSQANETPVDAELQRLYKESGQKSVLPGYAEKSYIQNREKRDLSASEYTMYAKEKGQAAFSILDKMIKAKAYTSADAKKQAEFVEVAYEYASMTAKNKTTGFPITGWVKKAIEAENNGISPDKFILYRNTLNDLKTNAQKNQMLLDDDASDKEKKAIYLAFVPSSDASAQKAAEKIQALTKTGLDMDDFLTMSVKYAAIDGKDSLSPQEKTTQFCKWLDTQGLTEKQYQTAQENFKYFSMFPAKPEAYKVDFTSGETQKSFKSLQDKYGLKEDVFMRGLTVVNSTTSDKDKTGKTVSGSLKMNRYAALRGLGWNHAAAKAFLIEVYGYKDKDWT